MPAEASSLAGAQQLGNLILIYDDNQISIEDNTDIAFSEDVGARYEAYGWHVQTRRLDQRRHATYDARTCRRCTPRSARPQRGDRQAELHRAAHDHRLARAQRPEHRQGPRLRARRRRGRRHQEGARLRPRRRPSRCRRRPRAHPRRPSSAARRPGAEWHDDVRRVGAQARPQTSTSSSGCRRATPPDGWADAPADVRRRREGHGHPRGVRRGHQRHRRARARAVGRLGRPGRAPTTPPSRARRRSCRRTAPPRCGRATRWPAGCCTSASASTPWARS